MGRINRAPVVVGGAILVVAAYGAWREWRLLDAGARADGVVVDQVVEQRTRTTFYYPVVEFSDQTGERVRFRDALGNGGGPVFEQGEAVTVVYLAEDPAQARIVSFFTLWLMPLGGALLGGAILAVGLFTGRRS